MSTSPKFIYEGKTLKTELQTRAIKIIDIAYVASIYLTLGAILSIFIDRKMGKFNPEEADKKFTQRCAPTN
jgi:hypothetical protein